MILNVAKDFSCTPGPRLREDGKHSAQEFRENILGPAVREAIETNAALTIDLDGTCGFAASFLDEAFGGLILQGTTQLAEFQKWVQFVSVEEPNFIGEVAAYMASADELWKAAVIPGSNADFILMEILNGPMANPLFMLHVPDNVLNGGEVGSFAAMKVEQDHSPFKRLTLTPD